MTIGQLAQQLSINIETIRYYERQGLITSPPRNPSGYREYSDQDMKRIQFILRAKDLGFSLKEILDLLSLKVDNNSTCRDVKRRAEEKLVGVEEKIHHLQSMKSALNQLIDSCSGTGPGSDCPILSALDGKEFNKL